MQLIDSLIDVGICRDVAGVISNYFYDDRFYNIQILTQFDCSQFQYTFSRELYIQQTHDKLVYGLDDFFAPHYKLIFDLHKKSPFIMTNSHQFYYFPKSKYMKFECVLNKVPFDKMIQFRDLYLNNQRCYVIKNITRA